MRPKPKVGQTLYSLNVGNAARNTEQILTPVVVKKVGRKYFTVGKDEFEWSNREYFITDWEENSKYAPTSRLYETEQEWLNEKETKDILRLIKDTFNWGTTKPVSLEKLRAIKKILEGE
jgi:hypothetical protein